MKFLSIFLAGAFFQVAACAQTSGPLLNTKDANALALRISQLMESTAATLPGLIQTGTTLTQNARQDVASLQANNNNSPATFDFLNQARAYLALSDTIPKPYPMPETARKQFIELREDVDRYGAYFQALLDQKEKQLRTPDRDNLHRYADANATLNAPSPNLTRVVFMGDSITDFWRLNEYFAGREYVNRGISGQITGEMLGRMQADVINLHPKAMLILGGTNDISRGISAGAIENNLSMIGDLCRANGIRPVFASITPVSDYHKAENPRNEMTKTRPISTIVEVNNWLREFCQKNHYVYVDYYNALRDSNGVLGADLADDGLHPNAKGYRIMAPLAVKGLDQALSETSPEEQPVSKKKHALPFGK
jgi:lysophospholipase L1-like esterase